MLTSRADTEPKRFTRLLYLFLRSSDELKERLRSRSHERQAVMIVEIANAARHILALLPRTIARKHGRR